MLLNLLFKLLIMIIEAVVESVNLVRIVHRENACHIR